MEKGQVEAIDPAETIADQRAVCLRHGLPEVPPEEMVALALASIGRMPICGFRRTLRPGDTIGWFLHCGEFSSSPDFYQPLHLAHLPERLPLVLPYLRLPPRTRFIIDAGGYEDVWRDETGE